jgi:mono/diheme cytochrome c family protein
MLRSYLLAATVLSLTPAARGADLAASAGELFAGQCITCHDPVANKGGLNLLDLAWRPGDPETFS